MARAIVTYARGWHALAITRSLGRRGIEVYCGEEAPFAPCFFSRYCTGDFQYPSVSDQPAAFLDALEQKVGELKLTADEPYVLIPVHKETWLIAQHRQRFEPHVRLALTTHENMVRTHDKGKLASLAAELGIPTPPTRQFTSTDELYRAVPELGFPAFLKVREGAAGVGLKRVSSPEELTSSFKDFVTGFGLEPSEYPIVQQFVEGEDYCTTMLYDHGRYVAGMTYRNVRSFPRDTGAGALRETVQLPEAERAARRLLDHLAWHGIAELDFRGAPDGPVFLIELNPRFFGGLSQAIAANVDYPHLLFRIACGEQIDAVPEVDYDKRTETPITGLVATLQEIAHDKERLRRFEKVYRELKVVGRSDLQSIRLRPFWDALKQAADPKDLSAYLKGMFEKHQDTISDVIQADDPKPALGVLYPIALALKHGKLSMGVLTSEEDLETERPRRRLRDMLRRPTWGVLLLTSLLFATSIFLINWEPTSNNLGWLLAWPSRLASRLFGDAEDLGTIAGAIAHAGYHALNFLFLYFCAVLALRQRRGDRQD
ncbi:MAG: ATP-grasp domain-containing protein [Phycisphaerales bacterium]|nr:MAG: ATP-grasp domain-containing protein [Phycisphaerales bacterium]